jgi:thymidine kinase
MDNLFRYIPRSDEFTEVERQIFMSKIKAELDKNVRSNLFSGLSKGLLAMESEIDGNKIIVKIKDIRPNTKFNKKFKQTKEGEKEAAEFFNVKESEEFFNVISEDAFKDRISEGAKQTTSRIMELLIDSRHLFRKL